jgi:alkylhydroperoxidase/carboxymuconolactone decarboxylase family protein YurZ
MGATAAIGASPACLEWSTGRALAAGASEDEIADALLAIAPVTGALDRQRRSRARDRAWA